MNRVKLSFLMAMLFFLSATAITSCKKDKEDEMTEDNNSNDDDDDDDEKGKGTISVIVRMGYCNDYIGELYVKVDGTDKGSLSNCNDDISCGDSDAAALNVEVDEGQHSVEVTSESYSGSYNITVDKDACKLIEIY